MRAGTDSVDAGTTTHEMTRRDKRSPSLKVLCRMCGGGLSVPADTIRDCLTQLLSDVAVQNRLSSWTIHRMRLQKPMSPIYLELSTLQASVMSGMEALLIPLVH